MNPLPYTPEVTLRRRAAETAQFERTAATGNRSWLGKRRRSASSARRVATDGSALAAAVPNTSIVADFWARKRGKTTAATIAGMLATKAPQRGKNGGPVGEMVVSRGGS